MVNQCLIKSCRALGSKGYYSFPKTSQAIIDQWKAVCDLGQDQVLKSSSRICFRHFNHTQFIRSGNLVRLRREAVPRREILIREFPTFEDLKTAAEPTPSTSGGFESQDQKIRKLSISIVHHDVTRDFVIEESKTVKDLYTMIKAIGKCDAPFKVRTISGIPESRTLLDLKLPIINVVDFYCANNECNEKFKSDFFSTSPEFKLLIEERMRIIEKDAEIDRLRKELEKSRKSNEKHVQEKSHIKSKLKELRKKIRKKVALTKKQRNDAVREALKDIFSPAQIECFLKGSKWQKSYKWTQEDYATAMTIRILDRRTYQFLRDKKLLPLPGVRSLQKYFSKFQINEGFLHSAGNLLKAVVSTLTEEEKVVGLAFDEVHVKKDISYDSQNDQIVGPFSKANTMLVRGIFKKFKMPVWFRYDTALKKEELFEIIKQVESFGLHVVSLTSDMGPDNRALATSLGITPYNTSFENPARPNNPIYFFFDVPHLLKLVRNNLLKYGFILPKEDGQFAPINKSMLDLIYQKLNQQGDVHIAHKLRDARIFEVSGQDKQNVSRAAKLLSETMSTAIRYLFPSDPNMKALADFILATDQWFDVCNSTKEEALKKPKCAYGVHPYLQSNILKKYRDLVLNLKVMNGQNAKMPWQVGIAVSSTSLLNIREYLKETYNVFTIATVVFNQDIVENTFSRLRAMGGSETRFGSLTFKYRLRDYILGSCRDLSIKNAPVVCDDESVKILTSEITNEFINDQTREPTVNISENDLEESSENVNALFKTAKGKPLPSVSFALPESVEEIVELSEFNPEEYYKMAVENEGLIYIAGWLGKKDAPELVVSSNEEYDKADFEDSKWINLLENKNLSVPKKEFFADLKKMDEMFSEYHKESEGSQKYNFKPFDLLRTPNVVKGFADCLREEFPTYQKFPRLIKRFAKGRTMFRMRQLQKHITQTESCRSKVTTVAFTY